jgi:hypothetical protein
MTPSEVLEDFIHHSLLDYWWDQSTSWAAQTGLNSTEYCLPLIVLSDTDIIVSTMHVELSEIACCKRRCWPSTYYNLCLQNLSTTSHDYDHDSQSHYLLQKGYKVGKGDKEEVKKGDYEWIEFPWQSLLILQVRVENRNEDYELKGVSLICAPLRW